jgi:hypothetical protein
VFGRVARVLAVLGLAVLPTVLLSTGPAAALCVGSSLCNPANAPLLAEFATSAGPSLTTAARTAGALSGASTAAPVAAVPLSSTATAAGAGSSVWGAAVGKIVTLLGGVAAWKFIAPPSGSPGLPPGGSSVAPLMGDGYYFVVTSVVFNASGTTSITYTRPHAPGGWKCFVTNGAGVIGNDGAGDAGAYGSYTSNLGPTSGGVKVGIKCWTHNGTYGNTMPGVQPTTPAALAAYNPGAGWTNFLTYGSFPGVATVPVRHIEQTVTCKSSAGVVTTATYVGPSATWAASELVDVAGLMCPSGSRTVGVTATVKTDGGADFVVADVPYVAGNALDTATADVPDLCYTATDCTLQLDRRTSTETDTYARVNPDNYPDWWEDPARDYLYRCVYGSSTTWIVVPIANCSIYRDPGPEWADPVPDTDVPESDPAGDCNFGWSDLLTGGIFVRGGKCVLTWAFVPSDGFMNSKVDEIRTSWDGTAPVVLFQTANSVWGPWYQARTVPSGCEGPSLTITNMVNDAHPFTACGEIAQAVVPIGKPLIAGVVLVGAVLGAARTLGRSFGIDASSRGEPM